MITAPVEGRATPDAVVLLDVDPPGGADAVCPFQSAVLRSFAVAGAAATPAARPREDGVGAGALRSLGISLRRTLTARGFPVPVYAGSLHAPDGLWLVLQRLVRDGRRHAVAVLLAPHGGEARREEARRAIEAARAELGPDAPQLDLVGPWHDAQGYVDAILSRVRRSAAPEGAAWIFLSRARGPGPDAMPVPADDVLLTADLVGEACDRWSWRVATEPSPAGASPFPDCVKVLREEAARGGREALLIPVDILCDCAEGRCALRDGGCETGVGLRVRCAGPPEAGTGCADAFAEAVGAVLAGTGGG